MTMPYERRKSVERTRELLVNIIYGQFVDEHEIDYEEAYRLIKKEVSRCIKHYPSEYHMDEARELAPEVFGDWQDDEKLTEVVVGGIVHTANDGYYYRRVVQDDGRTVKFFVEKKNG